MAYRGFTGPVDGYYGAAADYAREREAEAERDQAMRGGSPLYRKLGAAPLGNDFGRDYRMAGRGGAGPRGNAATSTMDRVNTIDVARDIDRFARQQEDRDSMAQRQRQYAALQQSRQAAMMQGGGGPPSSAAGRAGAGLTKGADGVLSGGGGAVSRRPESAPVAATAGMARSGPSLPAGIDGATAIAGGSPMQTAAYEEGMRRGPSGAGFNPGAAGPDGRGFASDAVNQPYDTGSWGEASPGFTMRDADMQEFLNGAPSASNPGGRNMEASWAANGPMPEPYDSRKVAEAMAAQFGSMDPFDATGTLRSERAADVLNGGGRNLDAQRAAMEALNPELSLTPAGAAIARFQRDVGQATNEAESVWDAILREKSGRMSPAEEQQFQFAMTKDEADRQLRETLGLGELDLGRQQLTARTAESEADRQLGYDTLAATTESNKLKYQPEPAPPPKFDMGAALNFQKARMEAAANTLNSLVADKTEKDKAQVVFDDAVAEAKSIIGRENVFSGAGTQPPPGAPTGGGDVPAQVREAARRGAAEEGISDEEAIELFRARTGGM